MASLASVKVHAPHARLERNVCPSLLAKQIIPSAPCNSACDNRRIRTCSTTRPMLQTRATGPTTPAVNAASAVVERVQQSRQDTTRVDGFADAEALLLQLLNTADLDQRLRQGGRQHDKNTAAAARQLASVVDAALLMAYGTQHAAQGQHLLPALDDNSNGQSVVDRLASSQGSDVYTDLQPADQAHLFLQRTLYRINRMVFFWFDDLKNYTNERSLYLACVRDGIEAAWQSWEREQFGTDRIEEIKKMSPEALKEALTKRYEHDMSPPLSETGDYISHHMGVEGYKELLAIGAIDGLVEASRQSRVCGGVANDVSVAVFRVLMEEYGAGRYAKKHSTFYAAMMRELGLQDKPEEAYFDVVPWQALSCANHNFLNTERRRYYLRYGGALSYFEIVGPSIYRTYLAAAKRLGLSDDASGYWALHIKEDERHGKWMLDEVAVPLVDRYPQDGWEVLLGYDQENFMAGRAGQAVLGRLRRADKEGFNFQPRI